MRVIIPQTDHAFDLILPSMSPAAHNAIYDVERFFTMPISIKAQPAKVATPVTEIQVTLK